MFIFNPIKQTEFYRFEKRSKDIFFTILFSCILKEFSLRFFLDIFSVNYSVNYSNNNLNLKLKEKHKFEFSIFVISLI